MEESKKILIEDAFRLEEEATVVTVAYDDQPDQVAEKFVKVLIGLGCAIEQFSVDGHPRRYYRISNLRDRSEA